jgi:hypothetical protein
MYVTRAAADLPLFHGVSRKKLIAWPATQVQSGGGIVDTGKPTGIRWRESTRSMVDLCALFRLDLKESGDKVAWIGGRPCQLVASSLVWLQRRCELILSCRPAAGASAAAAVPNQHQHLGTLASRTPLFCLFGFVSCWPAAGASTAAAVLHQHLGVSNAVLLFLCLALFFLLILSYSLRGRYMHWAVIYAYHRR